jgi:hypothetical protein
MTGEETSVADVNARLAALLPADAAAFVKHIPDTMKLELLADDANFLRCYQVTAKLAARFTPEMRHLASPDAMREVLRPTAFFNTRMQPVAGAIGHVAGQKNPKYGYFPYVPVNYDLDGDGDGNATLIVAVHGSSRNAIAQRNFFAKFAEDNDCFVLAPLFPIDFSLAVPDEEYKYVIGHTERYDQILFDLIDEFAALCNVRFDRILLCGFSGGGQFSHRIMYLHPEKFTAVSIGAPGSITLLDTQYKWWVGTKDVEELTGSPVNYDALRALPVHLICGRDDNLPFEIYSPAEMEMTEEAYLRYGRQRVERLERLRSDYENAGMNVCADLVENAAHAPDELIALITKFFAPFVKRQHADKDKVDNLAIA